MQTSGLLDEFAGHSSPHQKVLFPVNLHSFQDNFITGTHFIHMKSNFVSILSCFIALSVLICSVGGPAMFAESESSDAIKDEFWNGKAYEVGILALLGSPTVWKGEMVKTEGYLVGNAIEGFSMTHEPPQDWHIPSKSLIALNYNTNSDFADSASRARDEYQWIYVRIEGKFTMLGWRSNPNHTGFITVDDLTIVTKLSKRK
jgi:hypothetical protein